MATTAELKKIGKEYAASKGLKVIGSYDQEVANETCRVIVRGGKLTVEIHTTLAENQTVVRRAARESRASLILGVECLGSGDLFSKLTKEQQAEVDSKIVGFEYVTNF